MKSSIDTHDAPASSLTAVTTAPLGAYLTNAMIRRGEPLLHQQCWCWGCDIRRAEGNLLLEYGFEKHRPPDDAEGSSAYRLDLSCSPPSSVNALDVNHVEKRVRCVVLWGFGFFYADARVGGGIFLQRYRFTPKMCATCEIGLPLWKAAQLPLMDIPRTRQMRERALVLLRDAARWIESYERWVGEALGGEYRRLCVTCFKHSTFTPDEAIAEWRSIGDTCAEMLEERR